MTLNSVTNTLLAKGPGRFRFARGSAFVIGGADFAPGDPLGAFPGLVLGGTYSGEAEFKLADDEKVFAILIDDSSPLPVVVAKFGI